MSLRFEIICSTTQIQFDCFHRLCWVTIRRLNHHSSVCLHTKYKADGVKSPECILLHLNVPQFLPCEVEKSQHCLISFFFAFHIITLINWHAGSDSQHRSCADRCINMLITASSQSHDCTDCTDCLLLVIFIRPPAVAVHKEFHHTLSVTSESWCSHRWEERVDMWLILLPVLQFFVSFLPPSSAFSPTVCSSPPHVSLYTLYFLRSRRSSSALWAISALCWLMSASHHTGETAAVVFQLMFCLTSLSSWHLLVTSFCNLSVTSEENAFIQSDIQQWWPMAPADDRVLNRRSGKGSGCSPLFSIRLFATLDWTSSACVLWYCMDKKWIYFLLLFVVLNIF